MTPVSICSPTKPINILFHLVLIQTLIFVISAFSYPKLEQFMIVHLKVLPFNQSAEFSISSKYVT